MPEIEFLYNPCATVLQIVSVSRIKQLTHKVKHISSPFLKAIEVWAVKELYFFPTLKKEMKRKKVKNSCPSEK
jgi:hypothetical protein